VRTIYFTYLNIKLELRYVWKKLITKSMIINTYKRKKTLCDSLIHEGA